MAFGDEQRIVRQIMAEAWGEPQAVDWSRFNDVLFATPEPDVTRPSECAWIRPSVEVVSGGRRTVGGPTAVRETVGVVLFQVFTPAGVGHKPAADIAAAICAIFRDRQSEGMVFFEPQPRPIGLDPEGSGWYQFQVMVPFRRDEVA